MHLHKDDIETLWNGMCTGADEEAAIFEDQFQDPNMLVANNKFNRYAQKKLIPKFAIDFEFVLQHCIILLHQATIDT